MWHNQNPSDAHKTWKPRRSRPTLGWILKVLLGVAGITTIVLLRSNGWLPRRRASGGMEPLEVWLMVAGFTLLALVVVLKWKPWQRTKDTFPPSSEDLSWWQILLAVLGICLLIFTFPAFTIYRMLRP